MSYIFISYSKKDIEFARHLRQRLEDQGLAVWMDETQLVPSQKWWPSIERNIINCGAFVVIMSPNSQESDWVEREILVAENIEHRKPIFPVLLEGKQWSRLANIQYQDMRQGTAATTLHAEFVEELRKYVATEGVKAPPPLPEPVIGTDSVPLVTRSNRTRWVMAGIMGVLVIVAVSITIALLRQENNDRATPTLEQATGDVTKTIEAGVAAMVEQQTQIALAATKTPTLTATLTPSSTLTPTSQPTDSGIPLNVDTAIAATFTGEAIQTLNAIASYTKTPTPTFTPSSTWTDTPDIQGTVGRGVEETRIAIIASYTKTPTPTITLTPTRDPSVKVTSNGEWNSSIRVETFDGVEMALVPAGCFIMGSTDEQRQKATDQYVKNGSSETDAKFYTQDEQPTHRVCFDKPFWIDRYEVTNKQYGSEGSFKGDNKPRESVTWTDANAFCTQREARLPTEAEWEYVARGPDSLVYPWGNEFVVDNIVYSGNSGGQTADVGSKQGGVSWVGAYDLSGNVWEWVSDRYGSYTADEQTNPQGVQNGSSYALRGGSWVDDDTFVRAALRFFFPPDSVYGDLGFRCARSF